MSVLPVLQSGTIAKYPLTIANTIKTDKVCFVGDQEQRWVEAAPLASFTLVYTAVNSYEKNKLYEFWLSEKGAYADQALSNCFQITDSAIPGVPYNYCLFTNDKFVDTETSDGRFTFTLTVRQIRPN